MAISFSRKKVLASVFEVQPVGFGFRVGIDWCILLRLIVSVSGIVPTHTVIH